MDLHRPTAHFSARAWIALCLSIAFGVAGQLLMKWAALRTVGAALDWRTLAPIALALLIYSVGIVNWMYALRHTALSIAYPLTSLSYVGILAGSYYWFGEDLSVARVAGVALIFLGVLLVAVRTSPLGAEMPTPRVPRS